MRMERWALSPVLVMAVVLVLAVLTAGCGLSTAPEGALPDGSVEIALRAGEERTVDGTPLRVAFTALEADSRCPVDVVCVWQGNAAAAIALGLGMGPMHPFTLNTAIEPMSVDWSGVRVTVVGVAPEPRDGVAIRPEDYVVTLRLRAVPEG